MKQLIDMLKELMSSRFYGEVNIKFQDGRIMRVTKSQDMDPKAFQG